MKLKERPLEWWKGRKFSYWCRADINDERKINYTILHRSIGQGLQKHHFTSDDLVGGLEMHWCHTGIIKELKLINNEWFVTLVVGIVLPEDVA